MAGVLLPYQMQWINDPTPVRVYEKSRRNGISWSTAAEAALVAAAASGMDVWYIGYNKDMAEEFIRDSADWIGHYQLVAEAVSEEILNDGDKDILTFVIRCASGYRITALSSRPSNLRGKQGYVIIDEAAFHEQLDELLKAAMALLMWGGKVAIISTHDGVDNPFNQLCQDIRGGRKPYALHRTTFDEAVAQGLYRRICQVRGIEWTAAGEAAWVAGIYDQYGADADEELRVIPSNSGGAVLSRGLLELRADPVPILRLAQPDSWAEYPTEMRTADIADWCERELRPLLATLDGSREHVFGMDFARHGDLSVLVPLQIAADTRRHVPFAVELRNIPHAQQRQIVYYLLDRLPRLSAAWFDASGNGEYLAEAAHDRYGNRVAQIKLSNAWYSEHMPPLVAALEDDALRIPKDADIIDDLRALERIDGVIKLGRRSGKAGERHGDAAIALCLAYAASRSNTALPVTVAIEDGYNAPAYLDY